MLDHNYDSKMLAKYGRAYLDKKMRLVEARQLLTKTHRPDWTGPKPTLIGCRLLVWFAYVTDSKKYWPAWVMDGIPIFFMTRVLFWSWCRWWWRQVLKLALHAEQKCSERVVGLILPAMRD